MCKRTSKDSTQPSPYPPPERRARVSRVPRRPDDRAVAEPVVGDVLLPVVGYRWRSVERVEQGVDHASKEAEAFLEERPLHL